MCNTFVKWRNSSLKTPLKFMWWTNSVIEFVFEVSISSSNGCSSSYWIWKSLLKSWKQRGDHYWGIKSTSKFNFPFQCIKQSFITRGGILRLYGPHSTIVYSFIKKNFHWRGVNHFTVAVLVSQNPRPVNCWSNTNCTRKCCNKKLFW